MEIVRLEQQLGDHLLARGWTFSAAESCTGGLVLDRMTNIPGSSAYVLGGVVSYANEIKERVLGVKAETLITYGAVSEPTAREMVIGVLALMRTTLAVSITGIAGPGGGSDEKPVGLTYIAACVKGGDPVVRRHVWAGDRQAVKAASADEAIRMALELVNAEG